MKNLLGFVLLISSMTQCQERTSSDIKKQLELQNKYGLNAVKFNAFTAAIYLRDEKRINATLQAGKTPDEKTIVLAMECQLSKSIVLALIKKAGYTKNHRFSNGISYKTYTPNV